MSTKHRCLIKAGSNIGQIATGRTIALSWKAKADILITLQPADAEEHCRLSQLRLAWMWAGCEAKHHEALGDASKDKDWCYWQFKVRYLAPVMATDDEEFALLWERIGALSLLGAGGDAYRQLSDKAISHTDASVKQVAAALTAWEQRLQFEGIAYKSPDDYRFALQVESYEQTAKSLRAA